MKKSFFIVALLLMVFSLTGCVQDVANKVEEGKTKVEYMATMSKLVVQSADASLSLYTLYQNPLQYGTAEWKEDFYTNKEAIEKIHSEATTINVPADMQDKHDTFVSGLELAMNTNNTVATGIEKGEELTNTAKEQINESVTIFKSLSSVFTE
ncbi:hypothetical protein CVD28_01975 [Bacillus sp. M6-12]|uniref:hypothetical protein n=1 Tax=Bacillus sp. M6-12 TaxID=2054166 RepID=UPI000C7789B8|nr:hypothetical protein [Bacillus sp. M6-12]PLS19200.1 hypothetical protein CVD28_01975 [Bacillus sp. M6-12]